MGQEQNSPTDIHCEKKFANSIAENSVQHGGTKYINVKSHAIREDEKNLLINLHYCPTEMQLTDIMTKALPPARLEFLKMKLGMYKANLKDEC